MEIRTGFSLSVFALISTAGVYAGELTEARVTRIINEVSLIEPSGSSRTAKVADVVQGEIGLRTGIKSRSELLFQDDTLSRIGPESYFRFRSGTREITLEKGTVLLQVPKGLGGAKIHTAAVTASITGTTIMMEYQPKQSLKVLVLEGSLRLSVNGPLGDSLMLLPGKMVIMKPDAKRIPDPVTVDLKNLVKTSKLVNMPGTKKGSWPALPSAALIEKEVTLQDEAKKGKNLVETNLLIDGKGTKVLLASEQLLQSLSDRNSAIKMPPPPVPRTADIGPAPTIKQDGGPDHNEHTKETYGSDGHPVSVPIVINTPQDFTQHRGVGSVKIDSNDSVMVNTLMRVSDTTSNHGHGEIDINSRKTSGVAISITSSAQLLALMAAAPGAGGGGKITFQSSGGDIEVIGGTVQVDRGDVEMRNDGATGTIDLSNATLHGNVIKIGALGTNGTLNVGGGTISADSTIKLYAGGSSGTVNFTDNVTLKGNSVKVIAGDTVTIFNGKVVTINGPAPADVFTNNPNYTGFGGNASTTGTFGGQGANTHLLSQAPGY
jgi:hypothetical protein